MLRFLRNYKAIWFHKQLSICFLNCRREVSLKMLETTSERETASQLDQIEKSFSLWVTSCGFRSKRDELREKPVKGEIIFNVSEFFWQPRDPVAYILMSLWQRQPILTQPRDGNAPSYLHASRVCVVKETFRRRLKSNFTWWWTSLRALASRDASYFMLRANLPLNKRNINLRSLNVARRYLSSRNKCNVREISISTSLGVNVFIHQNVRNSCRALKLNNESKSLARNSVEGLMKPLEHIMSCEIWNYGELRLDERIKGILGNEVNLKADWGLIWKLLRQIERGFRECCQVNQKDSEKPSSQICWQ